MSEMPQNDESCSCEDASHNNAKDTRRENEQATTCTKREWQPRENVKKHCSGRLVMKNEDSDHPNQEFSESQSSQQNRSDYSSDDCSCCVRLESQTNCVAHQACSPKNDENHSCKQNKCTQTQPHGEYRDSTHSHHVPHYANAEAISIHEEPHAFVPSVGSLTSQSERDRFTRYNSGTLFSMIQHISNCSNEVLKNDARKVDISQKFDVAKNIYNLALSDKCLDSFTETQRENIRKWKDDLDSLRTADIKKEYDIDETVEVSNSNNIDEDRNGNIEQTGRHFQNEIQNLRRENEALKRQFLGFQHGISQMRSRHEEEIKKLKDEIERLRQDLQNSRRDIVRLSRKNAENEDHCNSSAVDNDDMGVGSTVSSSSSAKSERDARFISLISTYLRLYPRGTCIDTICSYLQQMDRTVNSREIQNLMEKFPTMYREETSFDGTRDVKKWKFIGFQS